MLYTMLKWLITVKSIRRQRDLRMTHFARINIAKAGDKIRNWIKRQELPSYYCRKEQP
jgi:hypothetical protein